MSHADEGRLHAYLDGELPDEEVVALRMHLEECEMCQERLDEARRVVAEADAVLAAAPQLPTDLPGLAEMEAEATRRRAAEVVGGEGGANRAGRPSPVGGRGAAGSLQRLAWAASVVVALGVGWMAREMAVPTGPVGPVATTPTMEGSAAAEPAEQIDAAAGNEAQPREGPGVGVAPEEEVAEALADAVPPAAVPEARQDAAAEVAPVGTTGVGDRPAELTRARAAPEASRMSAGAGTNFASADEGAIDSGQTGELGVPGLPILEVTRRAGSPEGAVLRILHRLPEGDTLEVLHLVDGADTAALPGPAFGVEELVVEDEDGSRVLRARRSPAELEALAARGGG